MCVCMYICIYMYVCVCHSKFIVPCEESWSWQRQRRRLSVRRRAGCFESARSQWLPPSEAITQKNYPSYLNISYMHTYIHTYKKYKIECFIFFVRYTAIHTYIQKQKQANLLGSECCGPGEVEPQLFKIHQTTLLLTQALRQWVCYIQGRKNAIMIWKTLSF
jgi:hypothetical protein